MSSSAFQTFRSNAGPSAASSKAKSRRLPAAYSFTCFCTGTSLRELFSAAGSTLARIAEAAHKADALFCVDLIQGLGAHGYDLPALGVDAACGASHKWLCAPEGIGYIYLSDRARELISPTLVGWISVEDAWDFADREQNYKPNALAWETGTGPSALFYGLEASLKLLIDADLRKVEAYLDELLVYFCERIAS